MYWEKEIETIKRKDLQTLQLKYLNNTLSNAIKSDYYKKLIKQTKLKNLKEIQTLPFTTKQDLRDNFPYGLLAINQKDIVRLHSSSGTTGNPTVIFHTQEDIDQWTDLVARCMYMTGVRKTDVFQNTMGYGLFTGGLGFHYGTEGNLGLTTLQRSAMPLLRYRTRNLTFIITKKCNCGRTHKRIARIKGRSDDILIINGVNIPNAN